MNYLEQFVSQSYYQKVNKIFKMKKKLYYLNHAQNLSKSKQCTSFSKETRFKQHNKSITDFNYDISLIKNNKSFSFGASERLSNAKNCQNPSPTQYSITKFPDKFRTTSLSYSRKDIVFRSLASEVEKKSILPGPGVYEVYSAPKNNKFTFKAKLPNYIDMSIKRMTPGPGHYHVEGINPKGKYYVSKLKNTRCITMGSSHSRNNKQDQKVSPNTYNIEGMGGQQKITEMKKNNRKLFGSQRRSSIVENHKLLVPGPGTYDYFSPFGQIELKTIKTSH